ncbi:hypothetical protein BH18ACI3_BH18ACI3_09920 [soil metagenome]
MKKTFFFIAFLGIFLSAFAIHGFGQPAFIPIGVRLQPFVTGLSSPIFVTNAKDGTKRVFIVERGGIIKVVQPGSNVPTDFLNISTKTSTEGERGLLGLAFHPQFATNRRFFVYYTQAVGGAIQIGEYKASTGNPNVAETTEKPILTIPHPNQSNHNGGTIAFGPDGYLYAAPGDGGGGNDPPNNAQNINQLLGKFLRIDINVPDGQSAPYLIPPTNPFASSIPGADEIYAVGMRNPYRFSFDRGGTNQLWVGDVGQSALEEVDIITNGGNYGWRVYEGTQCTNLDPALCVPANFIPPVFQYSSASSSQRCSITGGNVYRGTLGTLPDGAYVYGDFCTGEILMWNGSQSPLLDTSNFDLSSFGEDEDGELYITQLGSGNVQKIVPAKASADFDADFRTDFSLFRPSNGTWYILNGSSGAIRIQQFGVNNDIPTAEDYDGDRRTDLAVFRPSDGNWYVLRSRDATFTAVNFGVSGDIPVAGDYDGDSKADLALFRPSDGIWYIQRSTLGVTNFPWGVTGDIPVPGDYDGDGKNDVAVWRPSDSTWYWMNSTNRGISFIQYGQGGDVPAPGDFDGDGKNDLAVFRPAAGQWFIRHRLSNNFQVSSWGITGDIPVVGDYDNDGRDDIAVFRPSNGTWYVIGSATGIIQISGWGIAGDIPVPNRDHP